jgi:peptidoglycan DL-endopeptidase CwlO
MRSERRLPQAAVRRKLLVVALTLGVTAGTLAVPVAGADELTDKRTQAEQAAAKLQGLESRLMELGSETERAKGELDQAQTAVAEAERRASEANAERAERENELRTFAVEAYVVGNDSGSVDALFAESGGDAAQMRGYVDITTGKSQDFIDQLRATKHRAEQEAAELDGARSELEAKNRALEASLSEAESAVAEQVSIKSRLDDEVRELVEQEERRRAEEAARRAEAQARAEETARARTAEARPSGGGGGGSPAPAPPSAPAPAPGPTGPPPPPSSGGSAAVAAAMTRIGMPYVWAASGPNSFDCSGLTMWAWAQAGKSLPHYSGAQWSMSRKISAAEAAPGDLVFFWGPGDGGDPGHVGLYMGGGQMVHAPGRGRTVRTDSVGYWPGARVAYGRV